MNPERRDFLTLRTPPALLNMEEAAWYLGFAPHDIPILVQAGLLKPLGHPPLHGTKYFPTNALEQLRADVKWLARASDTIVQHWREKNIKRAEAETLMANEQEQAIAGNLRG